jgi:hypothetical protein
MHFLVIAMLLKAGMEDKLTHKGESPVFYRIFMHK